MNPNMMPAFPFLPQMPASGVPGMLPTQPGSADAQQQLGQHQFMPMPMMYPPANQQAGF